MKKKVLLVIYELIKWLGIILSIALFVSQFKFKDFLWIPVSLVISYLLYLFSVALSNHGFNKDTLIKFLNVKKYCCEINNIGALVWLLTLSCEEEVFFRYVLNAVFDEIYVKPLVWILISILFVFSHVLMGQRLSIIQCIDLFALSIILCILYHYSSNLTLVIITHFIRNCLVICRNNFYSYFKK